MRHVKTVYWESHPLYNCPGDNPTGHVFEYPQETVNGIMMNPDTAVCMHCTLVLVKDGNSWYSDEIVLTEWP